MSRDILVYCGVSIMFGTSMVSVAGTAWEGKTDSSVLGES